MNDIRTAIIAAFNKYGTADWMDIHASVEKTCMIKPNGWLKVRGVLQELLNSGIIRRDPRLDVEIYYVNH